MDSAASLNGNGPDVKAAEGHNAKVRPLCLSGRNRSVDYDYVPET